MLPSYVICWLGLTREIKRNKEKELQIIASFLFDVDSDEERRRKEFYASRGLPDIKAHITCKGKRSCHIQQQ